MDSAVQAAYELIAFTILGSAIIFFPLGYYVRSYMMRQKQESIEEEVRQIFPTSDPFEWDHFLVSAEQEPTL